MRILPFLILSSLLFSCSGETEHKVEMEIVEPVNPRVEAKDIKVESNTKMFTPDNVEMLPEGVKLAFVYSRSMDSINSELVTLVRNWGADNQCEFHTLQTDDDSGVVPFDMEYFFDLSVFLKNSYQGFVIVSGNECNHFPFNSEEEKELGKSFLAN